MPKQDKSGVSFCGLQLRHFHRMQAVAAGALVVCLVLGYAAYSGKDSANPSEPLFSIAVFGGLLSIAAIMIAGGCMGVAKLIASRDGRDR